ncbi:hypothetical protein KIN20_015106 [Parelaphostrongylus tenuis]|uniref:Uncharacterized protein n=1 Tax=Parelaphostrongylus tenuis TaxID=148309 RepID=A0AAD5MEF2_PARTN|nr:hypothetical protein KIN20_015106 [Parelaphostrongylus tenuis]
MSSHDSSSLDGTEVTLSPPDYSVLEDLSSGELRSRTQQMSRDILQKWPERPESGRYSLQYGYFDEKRFRTAREKRKRKNEKFSERRLCLNCAGAGASDETARYSSSDMIVPLQSCSAPRAKSSNHLVPTSMLSLSTTDIRLACPMQTSTSDDLHTLGGISQSSVHATDLQRPPNDPMTMTTVICPVQPPPVSHRHTTPER